MLVLLTHVGEFAGPDRAGALTRPAQMMDIGVAIFFVLSGFLIYRPFVAAHAAGARPMRLVAFWWRRLLRIVPAYWLALTVLWGLYVFHPGGFRMGFDLGASWWKYYAFAQVYDAYTALGGIVQAWSLCAEIGFYLCIPLWAMGVRRLTRRLRAGFAVEVAGVVALFAAGYLSRWWFSHNDALWVHPSAHQVAVTMRSVSFTWLPNQIDLFAIGMGVAVLHVWAGSNHRAGRLVGLVGRHAELWWAAAAGLFVLVVYVLGPPPLSGYRGAYWQGRQATYGGVSLLLLVPLVFGDQRRGLVRAVLRWKPVWWVGTVSYAFYLWHFAWMKRYVNRPTGFGSPGWQGWGHAVIGNANPWALVAIGLAGGLGAAAVSWYLVERPLLRLKSLVSPIPRSVPELPGRE